MHYKKILKRKRYDTWIARYKNYTLYIFKLNKLFHFQIWQNGSCIYLSLDNGLLFKDFELVKQSIDIWLNKHKLF